MKKIIYICLLVGFISTSVTAQKINWVSLEKAVELQKENPKKIMIDVYTNWCGPCRMLDKNTFHNKDVVDYVNANYYAVKFNAEGDEVINFKGQTFSNPDYKPELANRRNSVHQLTHAFQVSAYPTIVFMDEAANVIAPIKGYQTPPQLELYLKLFKDNKHKDIDSQEKFMEYAKAFKAQWKG